MVSIMTGDLSWVRPAVVSTPGDWLRCHCRDAQQCVRFDRVYDRVRLTEPDLLFVVGWRHMVPPDILAMTTVVGFHSARLPEYPGRAPVPWAILRGDTVTHNTMLYLTDEPDAGDIIDFREVPVSTASEMNRRMGETAAEMLRQHLPALLSGTAPRHPQDPSKRGPLTTADGWKRLPEALR